MVKTYAAGRRLQIGDGWREPGELAPEAHDWFRVDDWTHAGYIKETEVSEAAFRAALKKYKVANAGHILDLVGLTDGVTLEGPRGTPHLQALKPEPKTAAGKTKAK